MTLIDTMPFLVIALNPDRGNRAALAHDRPNIILISATTTALRAVSAYGDALIETPGVDRIAQQGMRVAMRR